MLNNWLKRFFHELSVKLAVAGALAVLPLLWKPTREFVFGRIAASWAWASGTIPISRGQCIVWFVIGVACGACGCLLARRKARVEETGLQPKILPVDAPAPAPLSDLEDAFMRDIARSDGRQTHPAALAGEHRLSQLKTDQIIDLLVARDFAFRANGYVYIKTKGRDYVISKGWA